MRQDRICIVNFSGRADGSCHRIAQIIARCHEPAHDVALLELAQLCVSPCALCHYECFSGGACPHGTDDVQRVYDAVCGAALAYYVLPNYCDYPSALFFLFNERSQSCFQARPERQEAYLATPKRFVVVSNTERENFRRALRDHIPEGEEPDILFLAARRYGRISIAGDLMDDAAAKADVQAFASRPPR